MDSRLILIKTRARKRSCSQDGWVWASMALAWVVTFLATWIGYTLVVFSLGAVYRADLLLTRDDNLVEGSLLPNALFIFT